MGYGRRPVLFSLCIEGNARIPVLFALFMVGGGHGIVEEGLL